MLLQMEVVSILLGLDPLILGGIILVGVFATYLGVHKLKYKNDPYFPYFINKNLDDVLVLLSERTPTGLAFVGFIKGKWGKYGLYIPDLDRVYTDIQFMSGKQKVVHLTKGVDGIYKPAGLCVVQTGIDYKKKIVHLGDDENPIPVSSVEEVKTAKVIKGGDFKNKEEEKSFLTLIIPSLEEYRLTLSSYIETYYQTAANSLLKNMNQNAKSFVKKVFDDMDRDKLVLLMIIGALLILYLLISDGITAMTRVCGVAATQSDNPLLGIINGTV